MPGQPVGARVAQSSRGDGSEGVQIGVVDLVPASSQATHVGGGVAQLLGARVSLRADAVIACDTAAVAVFRFSFAFHPIWVLGVNWVGKRAHVRRVMMPFIRE